VRIGDACWPHVAAYLATLSANDVLWDGWNRWTPTDTHRGVVTTPKLKLGDPLPLYNARHHWAAIRARIGTPIPILQAQLGHASPRLTLELYGRFMPTCADRNKWEGLLVRTAPRTAPRKRAARRPVQKNLVTL
jgi:hypothetical protein